MLTRLHVRGYKALRDIDTTLEPLTVLVGPNGCGKTSVLESIVMVRDFEVKGNEKASKIHPLEELQSKNDVQTSGIEIELWARLSAGAQEAIRETSADGNPSDELRIKFSSKQEHAHTSIDWDSRRKFRNPHHVAPNPRLVFARAHLRSTRLLALDLKALARPSYLREIAPIVEDDGSGLATVLSTLIGEQREKFEEIQSQLREFVPEIERIRLRPAPLSIVESQEVPVALDDEGKEILAKRRYQREVIGNEIVFDFRHANGVPAKHASEGTLLLLGLLTVALTDDVSVLLLDDVDRALHPKAQQQLVDYLRKLNARGVQVIATTHSPYLVLHLEYEEVRAMTMPDAGGALIGKLNEHPEYGRWSEHMSTSEFWTVFGEEWLAKVKDHG
jgi:predicted ATPase